MIFVLDFENWLLFSSAFTYADDTSTIVSEKHIKEAIANLKKDATIVFKFMASNRLVANPQKTL